MLAIGSRGILISREIDPVTNQFVWTTALDSHGLSTQIVNAIEINGSQIKGNTISSYDDTTWIDLDNGTFNFKNKIKYIDGNFSIVMKSDGTTTEEFLEEYEKDKEGVQKDIDEVYEAMNTLKDTIDDVINDGIITETELATISSAIIQLNKEKDDMVARYNNIKDDDYLSNEILIKLNEAFNNYIDIHNVLVSFINTIVADRVVTETEKGFYEDHSSDYGDKLSKLSVEIDNALSDILENSTAYQVKNLKTSLEKDFEDVYNRMDEILDDVGGVIADGIIDEAELLIIKNTIIQLDKEKEDVDMSYSSIYNNSDLNGTLKTNLKESYMSYTASHTNLKRVINNMIADGKATDQEKTSFDTAIKNYSTALANFKKYATLSLEMITKNYTDAKIEVLEDSISLKVSGAEMTEYVSGVKTSLQNQLDGKIESYYQTTNPGADWTSAERASHKGDIWHNSLSNVTYRWSGTNWIKLTDSDAETAKALANTKAKIFTATPTPPYNRGDLWVQGTSGDIMRCNTTRTSGSYIASDWSRASKYTDDTQANNVLNNLTTNYYTIKETDAQIKVAKDSITSTVSSSVQQAVDNIAIGGRNFIRQSDFRETYKWSTHQASFTRYDWGSGYIWYLCVSSTSGGIFQRMTDNHTVFEKDNYVFSLYLKGFNGSTVRFGFEGAEEFTTSITDTWVRYKVVLPKDRFDAWGNKTIIIYSQNAGYFDVAQPKLEKGNKATDWTPAPEEINDKLTYYATTSELKQTSDAITSTVSSTYARKNDVQNLQSQITQNANNISTKVSSNEFSTLFNQNAKAFNFTIGSSSGMNVRIDRDGITVKNGGLQVTNSNGTTIIDGSSNIFKIYAIYEVLLNPGSNLSYNHYINHNLGYTPAYTAFQVDSQSSMGTSNTLLPALNISRNGSGYLQFVGIIRCNASSSQIIINYERASTSVIAQVKVKVFVYKERLM